MVSERPHNDERRPLLDREPVEHIEDALEGRHVDYKTTGWKSSAVLLAKCQIGLGVLALPAALDTLGAVYGLLCICTLGLLITYSNHTVGVFWKNHPDIHSVADATRIIFGDVGAECMGVAFWMYEIGIAASGILATSIGFNVLTDHGACTVLFVGLATLLTCAMASFREFRHIAFLGWAGLFSIVAAICLLMGSVVSADKPPLAPEGDEWDKQLRLIGHPSAAAALSAVMNMLFAYGGTPAFFPILSEMRKPADYTKAMLSAQIGSTVFYIVVASVVWASVGVYIASPALGSAGPLIKKICYGVALPGLLAGAILYMHVSAKYLFVRLMRGTRHFHQETFWHWVGWLGSVAFCGLVSFTVAEAIPFFSSLLGVIGAAFGSIFCLILPACMFFFDRPSTKSPRTTRDVLLRLVNLAMIAVGVILMFGGIWASVLQIQDQYRTGQIGHPFSCANNA